MSKENIMLDGYVDTIQLRLDYLDKQYRDLIFNEIITFIKSKKLVSIKYDKERSNQYCQIVNLNSSNTKIATISKNSYTQSHIKQYTITISFFGLKRYIPTIDEKSMLLLKNIVAYLNTSNMPTSLTNLDLAMDVNCHEDQILAVPYNRGKKQYYQLGKYDEDGAMIQEYDGTYAIEKFTRDDDISNYPNEEERKSVVYKRMKNVLKLVYYYNKRKKNLEKYNFDTDYDLWRFEMKLQTRYFLKNEVSVNAFLQELKDYKLFYFEDTKIKDKFIKKYNKANNNKHRQRLIDELEKSTYIITPNMLKIGTFLRMLDTITFDGKDGFKIASKSNYLYGNSRFNKRFYKR